MANQTEMAKTLETVETIKNMVVEMIEPLANGKIVEMSPEDQKRISDVVRNLNTFVSSIREGHDIWIKFEWENANDGEFHLDTIRGTMRKEETNKSGFLKL